MAVCTLADQRSRQIESNRLEYGDTYDQLTFPTIDCASLALARRSELLARLSTSAEIGCCGTKLDMKDLSPGCRICVEGRWSCLFINGRCNTRCFYCPSSQDETGLPMTNSLTFRSPADYVAYLEQFGFRGMSLSGGEPLLTPGRSLAFLAAAKQRFGDRLHTWLYTNGTLVDADLLLRLRDAGLDEIRFDIGATGYDLRKVTQAVGVLPTVTVEIPAIPEDRECLQQRMVAMADLGVRHLNLHQLRLTPYSLHRFRGRPYTYLHGDKVTVLESELTALELIAYAKEQRLVLPVNYCSFVYKDRYQKSAARRRSASVMRKPYEAVTDAGYVRTMSLTADPTVLERIIGQFVAAGYDSSLWALNPNRNRLALVPELFRTIDDNGLTMVISYSDCAIRGQVSYRNPFREFRLPSGRKFVVERWVRQEFELEPSARAAAGVAADLGLALAEADERCTSFEQPAEGLQDYF